MRIFRVVFREGGLKYTNAQLCFFSVHYYSQKDIQKVKIVLYEVSQGYIQLFLKKKKGAIVILAVKSVKFKRKWCFCLWVYMIHVLHIEQGLLQEILQKCKCFYCHASFGEWQYFQRELIPSRKGL